MILARTHYDTQLQVRSCDGVRYRIGPGDVNGVLHIQAFEDRARGVDRDSGLLRLTFGFGTSSGDAHTYLCLLAAAALLPKGRTLHEPGGDVRAQITTKAVLDTRGMDPFFYEDGRQLWLGHRHNKYCDLSFQLREVEDGLLVRMRAYVISEEPDFHDYRVADYLLELRDLLWRRAARFSSDEVLPEEEKCVFIKSTGARLVEGVTPSAVEVMP